jgi:hypothetical protein
MMEKKVIKERKKTDKQKKSLLDKIKMMFCGEPSLLIYY